MSHETGRRVPKTQGRRSFLKLTAGASVAMGSLGLASAQAFGSGPVRGPGGDSDVFDVAIVGAGLAGLTAARELHRAGCDSFVVLEARDRVGGRTLTHDLGDGRISDAGGQRIGPGQTAIANLARELQIDTFPTYYTGKTVFLAGDGRQAVDLQGTFGTDPKIAAKLSALARDVPSGAPWKAPNAAELDKLSVGDWLAQQAIKPEDRVGWDITVFLSAGTTPAQMGLLHVLSMINSANSDYEQLDSIKNSAQETRIVGGSQILSIRMAQALQAHVRMSCPVRKITDWDRDVVSLHTDGGIVRARRVILAVHPALCHQLDFSPGLPEKRAALQRHWPAHTPARKTTMVYARPFWRDHGLNGQVLQADGPVMWAYDNSPPDAGIGVINSFVQQAVVPADLDTARNTLAAIYARGIGDEALKPLQYHEQDWGTSDPWTLSCVSAIPRGFWTTHGDALHPPCGNLIWSGTETADIWAGYMDGAVRSGHRAALQVLNALRNTVG
jgi:monoamine oxidase